MGSQLDPSTEVEGTLRFSDTLRIDGRFRGRIESDGLLIVGEKGDVDADISAGTVSIAGLVRGRIEVTQRIEIFKGGRLLCNVVTPAIRIDDGAVFQGHCDTTAGTPGNDKPRPLDMSQVARQLGS